MVYLPYVWTSLSLKEYSYFASIKIQPLVGFLGNKLHKEAISGIRLLRVPQRF